MNVDRGCSDMNGTEALRFGPLPCREAVAGKEAEEDMEGRRVTQVTERLNNFGGGVGGMDIHVGGVNASLSEAGVDGAVMKPFVPLDDEPKSRTEKSSKSRDDILVVGVHTGEALIDGRGGKPQVVGRRDCRSFASTTGDCASWSNRRSKSES